MARARLPSSEWWWARSVPPPARASGVGNHNGVPLLRVISPMTSARNDRSSSTPAVVFLITSKAYSTVAPGATTSCAQRYTEAVAGIGAGRRHGGSGGGLPVAAHPPRTGAPDQGRAQVD